MADGDEILANGVWAQNGQVLPAAPSLIPQPVAAHVESERAAAQTRFESVQAQVSNFDVDPDSDPNALADVGWSILFAQGEDTAAVEEVLAPLVALRRAEVGDDRLFKVFKGDDGYRAGDDAETWLARHGVALDVVNPRAGVPYYILIVGSPDAIPMTFQYKLDLFWAVGRLHLRSPGEYARYAQSVVAYERAENKPRTLRTVGMFAPEHAFEGAMKMFSSLVARPFRDGDGFNAPLGEKQKFRRLARMGEEATKKALGGLISDPAGVPALLFTGSHGMAFSPDDTRLPDHQGALVCQDWSSRGAIDESDWFSADDLPADARLSGVVHFMFACYGCGWGKVDTFRTGPGGVALPVAPVAAFSRLPQAMLTHANGGALAVIGHVDRAWSYSFKSETGVSQSTGMRSVLTNLLKGVRVGHATDAFNMRWAAVGVSLSDDLRAGGADPGKLAKAWIARDDARNYIIFGDPAVRLRVEDMPELPT